MQPNRFVILHHLAPNGEHWDFMIERENHLATWQMLREPVGREAFPIECVRINDHRKRYLDYEGPISGGRGVVSQVDRGTYRCSFVDEDAWVLWLEGQRLRGEFRLERNEAAGSGRWTCVAD